MNEISILFFDRGISRLKIEEIICDKFNLIVFDFSTEFRSQILNEKSELTKEIKKYLDNGEIIPMFVLEKFLVEKFSELKTKKTLLSGFPKTKEQYELLEKIFSNLKIQLKNIWYFEQNNPEKFKSEYYSQEEHKVWLEKFGEEVTENWNKVYLKGRESIQSIKEISKNIKWKIIKVEIENEKDENYIIEKINDNA
jgi:adenylate kinase family enzyme